VHWVLTHSGKVISRATVQHVTQEDLLKDETKKRLDKYETEISKQLRDTNFVDDGESPEAPYNDEKDLR
jgi:hypothetical protein